MTNKTCPFHQGFEFEPMSFRKLLINPEKKKCDGEGCQLWVKLMKDRVLTIGKDEHMIDPDAEYVYEGCGLVTAIPWILVNKAKVKK